MAEASIPEDITPDYVNAAVEEALAELRDTPDYTRLASFLEALRTGYLVVDITGTPQKKGTRIRTTRSTRGQLVLPLFTSMAELREAVAAGGRKAKGRGAAAAGDAKGAVMPAKEALRLIESDRFVAAELNPAHDPLVVLRKYIVLAAGDEAITAERLETMKQ